MDTIELNVHNSWEALGVEPSYAKCKYHSVIVFKRH